MVPALVLLIILAVIAIAYYSYLRKKKRQEEISALATRLGLRYDPGDPFFIDETMSHRLFSLGDGRDCENVVWGAWEGIPVTAFDYWYYTESTDSDGHTSRSYHRFSCAMTEFPAACPPLIVTPENLFTRMADGLGFRDIEFEDEDFNRTWQIKCGDPKFANDFIDQRMMAWLQYAGSGWSFEVCGPIVLAYCRKLPTNQVMNLLQCLKAFTQKIPRVVTDLYPDQRPGRGTSPGVPG